MQMLLLLLSVFAVTAVQGQSTEQDRMSLLSRYEKFAATPGRVTAVNKQYIGKVKEWRVEVRRVADVKSDSSLLGINFFFRENQTSFSFMIDADELPAVMDMLRYARQAMEDREKSKTYVDVATPNGVNVSCYYHAGLYIKTWYLVCRQVYPGTNLKAYDDVLQIPGTETGRLIALLEQAQTALTKL